MINYESKLLAFNWTEVGLSSEESSLFLAVARWKGNLKKHRFPYREYFVFRQSKHCGSIREKREGCC